MKSLCRFSLLFVSSLSVYAQAEPIVLHLDDLSAVGLTVQPPHPYLKTYLGPDRSIQFLGGTGGSMTMPYTLGAYFTQYGAFYTGVEMVMSNKRYDASGGIQGVSALPDGSEPSMLSISPDMNGPSLAIEAHGNMVNSFKNQSILAGYDLDNVSGGASPYSSGYGRKSFALGAKGQMFWGSNLETDPTVNADSKLAAEGGQITVGPQFKVKSDWGLDWPNQAAAVRESAILRLDAPSAGHSQIFFEEDGAAKWVLDQLNYYGAQGLPWFSFVGPSGRRAMMFNGTTNNVGIGKDPDGNRVSVSGNIALTGNVKVQNAGQGIILKSPNGAICKSITIDNAGALSLKTAACP